MELVIWFILNFGNLVGLKLWDLGMFIRETQKMEVLILIWAHTRESRINISFLAYSCN